ncbi:hypothetical protein BJX65DRAFT_307713 [Aspergillus insuetus]
MSSDGLIPICVAFCMSSRTHEIILVDENTSSFAELAKLVYDHVGPKIDDHFKPGGEERTITKLYVSWNQQATQHFPRETYFSDTNIKATLRLLAARRGIDMVYFWLNEIDEPAAEEEVQEEEEGY